MIARLAETSTWQLVLMRLRALWREPSSIFWIFVFPLLLSVVLGLAFRSSGNEPIRVAVTGASVRSPGLAALEGDPLLALNRVDEGEAQRLLRTGKVALIFQNASTPSLVVDPTQPAGREARLAVLAALARARGTQIELPQKEVPASSARYIDFLIPGLLGFALMESGFWGLGWQLVQMRTGKLLKRFAATPMRRSDFLLSFMITRGIIAVVEIAFFVAFAQLLMKVHVFGSLLSFFLFGLVGAFSFAALALVLGGTAKTLESANGMMNLAFLVMTLVSGVFFDASHFPSWSQPIIRALPLTVLNDGLRAIMNDGRSLSSLTGALVVLTLWGVGSFAVAVRLLRWT